MNMLSVKFAKIFETQIRRNPDFHHNAFAKGGLGFIKISTRSATSNS